MAAKKSASSKTQVGTFEMSLERLEKIVETLEEGSVSLDQVMTMYEEGVQLSKQCLEYLNQADLKLKRLSKDVHGKFELLDHDLND